MSFQVTSPKIWFMNAEHQDVEAANWGKDAEFGGNLASFMKF